MTRRSSISTLFPYTTLFRSVIKEGLPEAYHSVFEDLSNEELAVVMLLKARLDGVQARVGEDYERFVRSEEHTSELQSLRHLVCRLLLEKKKNTKIAERLQLI